MLFLILYSKLADNGLFPNEIESILKLLYAVCERQAAQNRQVCPVNTIWYKENEYERISN